MCGLVSTFVAVAVLVNQDLGSRMTAIEKTVNSYDGKLTRYDKDDCDARIKILEADMRYVGQSYELTIATSGPAICWIWLAKNG